MNFNKLSKATRIVIP